MKPVNEFKVGDVTVKGGIKTTVTDVDPQTGAVEWDIEYAADYLKLYQQVQQLFKTVDKAARHSNAEPFIKDWGQDVRNLRNSLRTYLRNNKSEEYNRVKNVHEMSLSGEAGGYLSKNAFEKDQELKESNPGSTLGPGPKANEDGVKDNAYVKQFKYKLVNKKALNKQAKGIEVKHLWGK